MQFIVPQFIDIEDKIIGPITTRQFIMGIVAALFIFLAYRFADTVLFIIEALVIGGLYLLVAFVKVNGRPFYFFLLNIFESLKKPKLRVWHKKDLALKIKAKKEEGKEEEAAPLAPKKLLAEHNLSSLALLVDTGGRYRPEEILEDKSEKLKVKS